MNIRKKNSKSYKIISFDKFNQRELKFEILREARVVALPMGMTELIAEKIAGRMGIWLKKHGQVSEPDFTEHLAKVAREYNPDLAFMLTNRDRMI